MPVEFLSDAEAAAYGRFDGALSRVELDRVFFLDDADRELIDKRRGAPNQLGFALQLTTVRWLGTFLPDPTDIPLVVLAYVARQLEIEDPSCMAGYLDRRRTRFEHAEETKAAEGLRDFAAVSDEFEEWVAARSYMTGDGPRAIFADAVGWLGERRVLLPGVTTPARLVARARAEGDRRLWETLAAGQSESEFVALDGLLEVAEGGGSRTWSRRAKVRPTRRARTSSSRFIVYAASMGSGSMRSGSAPWCQRGGWWSWRATGPRWLCAALADGGAGAALSAKLAAAVGRLLQAFASIRTGAM